MAFVMARSMPFSLTKKVCVDFGEVVRVACVVVVTSTGGPTKGGVITTIGSGVGGTNFGKSFGMAKFKYELPKRDARAQYSRYRICP